MTTHLLPVIMKFPNFINEATLFDRQSTPVAKKAQKNNRHILFITTFPPRACGIATYTQDLISALNDQFENSLTCSVCALENNLEQPVYLQKPAYILNTDASNAFVKMAFQINRNPDIDQVVIQHEFGLFASKEADFTQFYQSLNKSLIFVFHTVLPNPNQALKLKVQEMAAAAGSVVVMTQHAAGLLIADYAIDSEKITVIPHGTHLVPPTDRVQLKQNHGLTDRKVLSTFGFLSSSKNIETTLAALPRIAQLHPEVLFLILGKTHPNVAKEEGEKYINSLRAMVKDLRMEPHVQFVNEYLALPRLLEFLQLSDIYLFTSKDPHQAVSGTFSYAVSCGCPVISTPIPHAKEVLNGNNGIIIDFECPDQLAAAVILLLNDDQKRHEISMNSLHKMAATAWNNSAIAHARLFNKQAEHPKPLQYCIPAVSLDHIRRMTTDIGLIQFAHIANPDVQSGYTIDDNARALIALCQHYELFKKPADLALISIYLQFIKNGLQPNGRLLNYVNEHNEFTDQNHRENLEDCHGRAIWALGYVVSLHQILPKALTHEADWILEQIIPHFSTIHSTRAIAFAIKGLHFQHNPAHLFLLQTLANRLVLMYRHESSKDWLWYENYLTYGNSVLPEALLCAYLSTNERVYQKVAIESFDFLLSKIIVKGHLKVISNKGWLIKGTEPTKQLGGEQPIDVAYTILALEKMFYLTQNEYYKTLMTTSFNWFLGDNHLHQIMYNPCTGGCYDGLEADNVNLNQGAESTVSYLLARLAMERVLSKHLLNRVQETALKTNITAPQLVEKFNYLEPV
ncbi:MAG: mannosyltransferase [Flavobacterium sp. BFFFF2]|nr:MAG: mannosyltransferase [Flavobacterium sp. BFFFF2]